MTEHILFVTGKLAEKRLHNVLAGMQPCDFSYEVRNIGVSVAALMTAQMLKRRLSALDGVDKVIVPGLCRGNLQELAEVLGRPVIRGTVDVKDLPVLFGEQPAPLSLDKHDVRLFAEIVDAPMLDVTAIIERARTYQADGADVIDLGCLPDTAFPHLEESVMALKEAGFSVSVDSLEDDDLLRAGRAGADYLLSLKPGNAWIAAEVDAIPIVIPQDHTDMASLYALIERFLAQGQAFIADSILDPVHFGFTASLQRYAELCARYPDIEVMMGVGNLTELTEADTTGINAVLFGIISELGIRNVLTTAVSPHARTAVREADLARRIMFAARENDGLPKGIDRSLLAGHERKPFPYDEDEIRELAAQIRDPSYRIEVSDSGIHVFNRDGMVTAQDAFSFFPRLALLQDDAAHAFYMGVELARAEVALRLGKRYVQDEELAWGVIADVPKQATESGKAAHTLRKQFMLAEEYQKPGSTRQQKP